MFKINLKEKRLQEKIKNSLHNFKWDQIEYYERVNYEKQRLKESIEELKAISNVLSISYLVTFVHSSSHNQ